MRNVLFSVSVLVLLASTMLRAQQPVQNNKQLAAVLENYYQEGLKLNPISATYNGDNRYNDVLLIDFTDNARLERQQLYKKYLTALQPFRREKLNEGDKINYDMLQRELQMGLEGLEHKTYLIVFNQQRGLPSTLAQLGSGSSAQPFKTPTDYENWLKRAAVFPAWTDSAIVYFKRGIKEGVVLPKALVEKMIPQLRTLAVTDPTKSILYGPITKLPTNFSPTDKDRFTAAYTKLITTQLNPSYQKLHDFLKNEYLPQARSTSGISDIPNGKEIYSYSIRLHTTTNQSAEQVYQTGIAEVKRIQGEMEKVKKEMGYKGTLKELFSYMKSDPKFFPYKTPEEILAAYTAIQKRIEPKLKTMFNNTPKTPFEVRQVEAFRAASAAPSYSVGSLENNRSGIFYVPIVDVSKTSVDESIFLHEAIPGHHYQLALQRENTALPEFRRNGGVGAYIEGWGLYSESLGKELGLYTDPYQYLQAMSWEIHRAIRLVVDAGMHAKGWSREQAIKYMLDNEAITEQFAISEIERYMSWPGQALSYKIGELKMQELKRKYQKQLGNAFNIAAFHDELLKDGPVPLDILENKMNAWAKNQTKK